MVMQSSTGILREFYRVMQSCTGLCRVVPSCSEMNRDWDTFTGLSNVVKSYAELYRVLQSCKGF